jgi:hypothetical protein
MKTNLFLKYITGESEFVPLELIPPKNLTALECMDIYRNGYFARLSEVLGEHFGACWKILGDETFQDICTEYILNHPSSEWNINRYGKSFPAMINSNFAVEDYPFIGDLAILEWNKQSLFHKKDDEGLNAEEGQKLGLNENAKIKLVSSMQIGTSIFNIPTIYSAAKSNENHFPENWEEPTSWILYKKDNQVYIHLISRALFLMLTELINGKTINEALQKFESAHKNSAKTPEEQSEEVKTLFQWISTQKLIKKISY